ncbi:MAG: NlpC/P60 family protein [Finegoldia sp.]|uniref:C40 family peptidase n=1 Tax=Finegoldia sp. TaxID=1981334 RepID=UPI00399629BE
MNKKGLGLSIGLASVIAVGTFVSPYLSSTTLQGKNNIVTNDLKYSAYINNDVKLSPQVDKEVKEKALNEIRNSQVRNVLNDSNRIVSKKQAENSKNNINTDIQEEVSHHKEIKVSENNVSTYKKINVKVDSKKDKPYNKKVDSEASGKVSENNEISRPQLKKEKSEVASLTLSRNFDNEEEKIYSNITKSTTGDLFVREKANKESEAIGVLSKDTKVVVKDDSNKSWAKIEYNNKDAYVSKDYLAKDKSEQSNNVKKISESKKDNKKSKDTVRSNSTKTLENMWVISPVYLRSGKSISSEKLGVLDKNTKVLGNVEDGWFKTSVNGKEGFISLKYLQNKKAEEKQNGKIQISEVKNKEQVQSSNAINFEGTSYTGYVKESVNVRDKDSMDSSIISILEKGTKVSGIKGKYWLKISEGKYISVNYIQDNKVDSNQARNAEVKDSFTKKSKSNKVRTNEGGSGSAVAQAAYNYLGERYVWGSARPGVGFDCSGLTSYLYNKVCGISLYRNSAAQSNNGYPVTRKNLKQGDLLFFSTNGSGSISHVGIYVGNGKMIHASTPSTGVIISDIDSNYYSSTFVTARRILN